jgi:hypothetical protein
MGMGDAMGGGGPPPAPAPSAPPAPAEDQGPTTIFLSKEVLGGKTVKEGDTMTLTVKSVDSETGDAEATVGEAAGSEMGGGDTEGGADVAFDKSFPPEPGEGQ